MSSISRMAVGTVIGLPATANWDQWENRHWQLNSFQFLNFTRNIYGVPWQWPQRTSIFPLGNQDCVSLTGSNCWNRNQSFLGWKCHGTSVPWNTKNGPDKIGRTLSPETATDFVLGFMGPGHTKSAKAKLNQGHPEAEGQQMWLYISSVIPVQLEKPAC